MICASPKPSCPSVADFASEVAQAKTVRVTLPARLLVFRNPLRRLISAYLNKYVEHSRYREESLRLCRGARLECFADFVDELAEHGYPLHRQGALQTPAQPLSVLGLCPYPRCGGHRAAATIRQRGLRHGSGDALSRSW